MRKRKAQMVYNLLHVVIVVPWLVGRSVLVVTGQ